VAEELQVAPLPLELFDYELPANLIAQEPITPRDAARLLVVRRHDAAISHHQVRDLADLLRPGDLLVFNNTRVVPARLYGTRARTGGKWEGLFLRVTEAGLWELMCQTRGRLTAGEVVTVPGEAGCLTPADERQAASGHGLTLKLVETTAAGTWLVRPDRPDSWLDLLDTFGHVPLPPYIRGGRDQPTDRERYQTVFAQAPGAVAAPTAGLHFTPDLLDELSRRGIQHTFVTLHVGAGTFRPIGVEDVTRHVMHAEWGELSAEAADAIAGCKRRGTRIIAVGTTTVRVLETAAAQHASAEVAPWSGETRVYIHPPHRFRLVDALLTNFHLPRSSLLVLVSAFAGIDLIRRAYEIAIADRYRFYSYGDAMLIV
jgi:S-adenosylmethionine:tRNA ribosyltransferase-isomerase